MRQIFAVLGVGCLTLLLTSVPSGLEARHIIGGVITYECLGGGDYEFTMKIYRDCGCTDCAQFDDRAFIAIYECDGDADCERLGQRNYVARLDVPIGRIASVDRPDYPCLIPPNVCVQEGLYVFKLSNYGIRLPVSSKSYHISYQRCCRNVTINNISRPGDSGATYTIEITPEAQRLCNNSPVFDDFPPTVICAGAPLNFDHSATDKDGDQLVYEFCPPLLGGGPSLDQASYVTCIGALPTPACPPPYSTVNFIVPTFSPKAPMGGNPVVSIDPNTGIITGTPTVQGQFVVGVCVKEYRNGVLLSKVFRDFQFNVARCDPTVVADIKEDQKIQDREYLINACGNFTLKFINESYQRPFISRFEWRFNIQGERKTFTDWEPSVTFPGVGEYTGQLILNPNTDCGDTANIVVRLFPAINADFTFAYDTCIAGPVLFTDRSETGADRITSWEWSFGDENGSDQRNPRHVFRRPGEMPVSLKVTDNNSCVDVATKTVRYFPVPGLIVVSPSSFLGCAPADIYFNNLSSPIDETYDIDWDFGDGGSSGEISPWHTYADPGVYSVKVAITSPIGCTTDTTFNNLIRVEEAPLADFTYTPEEPSNINATVYFTDESERAVRWLWDFGTGDNSQLRNPTYTFPDTGLYEVRQIVFHPNGCRDTLIREVDVVPEIRYHLPNAFTPNEDAVNDEFRGTGFLVGASNFSFSIWNRWGELVFQTKNPLEGWNGRQFNTGPPAPSGVYVVLVTFSGPRGEPFEYKGFATLLR